MYKCTTITVLFFLIIITTTAFAKSSEETFDPFPQNRGSQFEYSQDDIPEFCFFPEEKARWKGYEVTSKEWTLLTDYQKAMFVEEFVIEMEKALGQEIKIDDGWKFLIAMNGFVDNCKESGCLTQSMARVLKDLLEMNRGEE